MRYVLLAAAMSWSAALALERVSPGAFDFIGIYASARLVAVGRPADVADASAIRAVVHEIEPRRAGFLNNANLPVTSLLLAPLGALPFDAAYLAMLTLGTAALVGCALMLAPGSALAASLVLLAPASVLALAHGQTTPFVLLGLLGSRRLNGFASGLALASAVFRPQILPLYALLAIGDRAKSLGLIAGVVAAALVSLAMIGPAGVPGFIGIVLDVARERGGSELGLAALAQRAGLAPAGVDAGVLALAISAAVLAVGVVAVVRARRRFETAGAWALLAAPHALLHDLLFAYPAAMAPRPAVGALLLATGTLALLLQLLGLPALNVWLVALAVVTARTRAVAAS